MKGNEVRLMNRKVMALFLVLTNLVSVGQIRKQKNDPRQWAAESFREWCQRNPNKSVVDRFLPAFGTTYTVTCVGDKWVGKLSDLWMYDDMPSATSAQRSGAQSHCADPASTIQTLEVKVKAAIQHPKRDATMMIHTIKPREFKRVNQELLQCADGFYDRLTTDGPEVRGQFSDFRSYEDLQVSIYRYKKFHGLLDK